MDESSQLEVSKNPYSAWLSAAAYEEPPDSYFSNVDLNRFWFPEELSPWYFLKSYSQLPPEIQLRYNQLYALGTNEVFAVFEVNFICRILKSLKKGLNSSTHLYLTLDRIDKEEEKHARVFHKLNQAAAPEYYDPKSHGQFLVPKADGLGVKILNLISSYPNIFGVWVWVALFFEERSILYSKFYNSSPQLDQKFRDVHRWHLIEEVNHVKMDELLVEEFYLNLSSWKRWLARFFLARIMSSFRAPKRMSFAIANVLKSEFPEYGAQINQVLSELPSLKNNKQFQYTLFGTKAFHRTERLMRRCPELASLLKP